MIFTPQQASPALGARLFQSRGGAAAPVWWNPDGATPAGVCVGAYQAKAAASYAASKVNLPTPGVNDLIEGNGAVPWGAGAGWGFVLAANQYFDTGIVVAASTWSVLAQFSAIVGANGAIFGALAGANRYLIQPNAGGSVRYFNGGGAIRVVVPAHLTGNLGMGGKQGYRDGLPDGAALPAGGATPAINTYLCALNNGGAAAFYMTVSA
ncbi:unnamed protein product, partial [marine sediment metagenome]